MDPAEQVPPVVAVVVTHDPGPWLEEVLEAFAEQTYRNLSVLVVDAGSQRDPTPRVAAVLPGAYVRRLEANVGYAAAANEVLGAVEGASHYLLCHDDVAPEPEALRLMVEEAYRSNAGVVTPKLVDWHDARRLLQVGMGADKSGAPAPLVDRGDFDQGQHDGVRDVFVAPGGCTLVRADLFADLGGFDAGLSLFGEDLDLSWRAQVSGARVVVAPQARVRHLEAMSNGQRVLPDGSPPPGSPDAPALRATVRPLQLRHRLRTVLTCYGPVHLLRVLPQMVVLAVGEVVFGALSGHTRTAADTVRAWTWNLRRLREVRAGRRRVRSRRRVGDAEVRRLMAVGSARLTGFVRGQLASQRILRRTEEALGRLAVDEAGTGAAVRPRHPAAATRTGAPVRPPGARLTAAVVVGIAAVLLVGSRHLITGRIPAVAELAPFPAGMGTFVTSLFSGWRPTGLGTSGPAPPALALLGLGSILTAGSTALLRTLVILAVLPIGAVGAWRLAGPLRSRRANLTAVVVYVAVPLPYNALANGRLAGLVGYALAPWVLLRVLSAGGAEPFDRGSEGTVLRRSLGLGLGLAVAASFAPSALFVVVLTALGLALGAVLAGGGGALRGAAAASVALLVAVALLLPWTAEFASARGFDALVGASGMESGAAGLGALLRFQTGPLGAPPLGWAPLAVAGLALLVGRGWRLAWAVRLWAVVLLSVGVAWAGGRGWLGLRVPSAELLLAPAAAALAMAAALGIAAVEIDLRGYRFGWRQLVPGAAALAVVLACLPVAGAALGGRWNTPRADYAGLLSWMPALRDEGAFRVLWVGDPLALPLGSFRLGDGTGYATSRGGAPDVRTLWPGGGSGGTDLVADALDVARADGTTTLGHLLGPTAIRFVVVPRRAAPGSSRLADRPPPDDLVAALDAQLDLRKLPTEEGVLVWENTAWVPGRARLEPGDVEASRSGGLAGARTARLSGSVAVLPRERGLTRFSGPLREADTVLVSEASSPHWRLRVDGRPAARSTAFGWANGFAVPASGAATLAYRTAPQHYGLLALQVLAWAALARWLWRTRRRPPAGP